MAGHTVLVTANVRSGLLRAEARDVLRAILATEPDIVALQEWFPARIRLLSESGDVVRVPGLRVARRRAPDRDPRYQWVSPLIGGCAIGARAKRYSLIEFGTRTLSRPGRSERPDHWLHLEPPRLACVVLLRDELSHRRVCVINYHLVPGVQAGSGYRDNRPVLVRRHRHEVRELQNLVDERIALGDVVYAMGDANFDGLRLTGLVSAWEGRNGDPGTLGPRRKVDDVHGPVPAESVRLLANASDHRAVIVDRLDE